MSIAHTNWKFRSRFKLKKEKKLNQIAIVIQIESNKKVR